MKKNKKILVFIGAFFILIGVLAISLSLTDSQPTQVFWMCYAGLILLGFGILFESDILILAQLNILTISFIIWTIDFFYYLATRQPLLGITDYFFTLNRPWFQQFISLQHVYTIPLALYALAKIKIKEKGAWIISIIEMVIFFVISKIFTSPGENINCVFTSCIPFTIKNYYVLLWFAVVIAGIILTHTIYKKIPLFNSTKRK